MNILSGTISLIAFIVFLATLPRSSEKPPKIMVGDVFYAYNPGKSRVPGKPDEPFFSFHTVREINGENVCVKTVFAHLSGKVFILEENWEPADNYFGSYYYRQLRDGNEVAK